VLVRGNAEKQQTLDIVMLHETQQCNVETLPHFAERKTQRQPPSMNLFDATANSYQPVKDNQTSK